MIDIKVPTVGESINEVTLVKWLKNDGDYVERDEVIAELESEKATFEVNAEKAGVLKTVGKEGDTLNIGDVLAQIDETAEKKETAKPSEAKAPSTNEGKAAPAEQPRKEEVAPQSHPAVIAPADIKATPVASAILVKARW